MKPTLIEVEYLKGGRRRHMKKVFADTLTKLGVVKVIEPQQPSAPIKSPLPRQEYSPLALVVSDLPSVDVEDEAIEEKPKRKRLYKRRDMEADDTE